MNKRIYIAGILCTGILMACNENELDIVNYGSIRGQIFDGETYAPMSGVMVTTSPASVAVLSDAEGLFTISRVREGDAVVTVKKQKYLGTSLTAAVYADDTTKLNFLIFKDETSGTVSIYDPVPGNGASDQDISFTFKWSAEAEERGYELTYNVYIFESSSTVQKLVGEDITEKEIGVIGLKYSKVYYWYVVAKHKGVKVANSPTWSFQTKEE